jgi:hypothetical protein
MNHGLVVATLQAAYYALLLSNHALLLLTLCHAVMCRAFASPD